MITPETTELRRAELYESACQRLCVARQRVEMVLGYVDKGSALERKLRAILELLSVDHTDPVPGEGVSDAS